MSGQKIKYLFYTKIQSISTIHFIKKSIKNKEKYECDENGFNEVL